MQPPREKPVTPKPSLSAPANFKPIKSASPPVAPSVKPAAPSVKPVPTTTPPLTPAARAPQKAPSVKPQPRPVPAPVSRSAKVTEESVVLKPEDDEIIELPVKKKPATVPAKPMSQDQRPVKKSSGDPGEEEFFRMLDE